MKEFTIQRHNQIQTLKTKKANSSEKSKITGRGNEYFSLELLKKIQIPF